MSGNTELQSVTANASTSGGGLDTLAQSVLQHISQTQGDQTNEVTNNNQSEAQSVSNAENDLLKRSRDSLENTVASGSGNPAAPTTPGNPSGNFTQSQTNTGQVSEATGNPVATTPHPTTAVKPESSSSPEDAPRGKRARKPSKRAMEALDDTNLFLDDEGGLGVSFGQGVIGNYYREGDSASDSDLDGSGTRRRRVGGTANRARTATSGVYGSHAPPGSAPFDASAALPNLMGQGGNVGSNPMMSGANALNPSALSALSMSFPSVPGMTPAGVNAALASLFNPRPQKVRSGRPRASHPTPATTFMNALSAALMNTGTSGANNNLLSSLLGTTGGTNTSTQSPSSTAALTSLLMGLPGGTSGNPNDTSNALASLLGGQSATGSNPLAALGGTGPDGKPNAGGNVPGGQGANDPLMMATLAALNPSGAPPAGSAEGNQANQNVGADGSVQKVEGGGQDGDGANAAKKEGQDGNKEGDDANKVGGSGNTPSNDALLQQLLGNTGQPGSSPGADANNPNSQQGLNLLSLLLPGGGNQPSNDPNAINPLLSLLTTPGGPLTIPGLTSGPPITIGRRKGAYPTSRTQTPASRSISLNCALCGITHSTWSEGEGHMREAHPAEYEQSLNWRRVTQRTNPDGSRTIDHGDSTTTTINPDGSTNSTSSDPTLHERITFSPLGYATNLPMRCRHCGKAWEGRPEALIVHEQAHFNTFSCPHNLASGCTFTAGSKGALDRHLAKTHGETQPLPAYPCTKDRNCSYVATRLDTLRRHEATHIAPEHRQRFMCDVIGCGRSFANQGHLSRHRKKHDGVQFACERIGCYATFAQAADLKMHVDSVHLGLRWPCPAPGCGHMATQRGSLLRHVSRRHPGIQEEPWWRDTWKSLKQVQGVVPQTNNLPPAGSRNNAVDPMNSAFPHSLVGLLNPSGTDDMNASNIAAALQSFTAAVGGQNQSNLGNLNVMPSVDGSQNLSMQQMLQNVPGMQGNPQSQVPNVPMMPPATNDPQFHRPNENAPQMPQVGSMEQKSEPMQQEQHKPVVSM